MKIIPKSAGHAAVVLGIALLGAAELCCNPVRGLRDASPRADSLSLMAGALLSIALTRRERFPPVAGSPRHRMTSSGHLTMLSHPRDVGADVGEARIGSLAAVEEGNGCSVHELPLRLTGTGSCIKPNRS